MSEKEEIRLKFAKSIWDEYPKNIIDSNADISGESKIGSDGFGWVRQEDGTLYRMPHQGNIVIEKDVLIRQYVTIDRAVIGSTVIGEGTKIDHHVHIAHGCKIGKHNTIANGTSIEGSCIVGDYNTFGSNVTVRTKAKIGSYCIIGSGSVVVKDVPDGSIVAGNPAKEIKK